MSGITPILDTLLHQVLGKRVDFPAARPLNEPVQPMNPADALRALHSDSRLDARRAPLTSHSGVVARGQASDTPVTAPSPGAPPASTSTHFSPAATTIADLLVKFPAPPSVIKPATVLMPATGPSPPAPLLANRLQASVNESGLFYESHLNKWFRGELPRQTLEHEPQMWRTQGLRSTPGEIPLQGGLRPVSVPLPRAPLLPSTAGFISLNEQPLSVRDGMTVFRPAAAPSPSLDIPGGTSQRASTIMSPVTPPASSVLPSSPANMEAPVASLPADPISEALQGIVRHQLELLVTPVLRWEGDVWSGIFMALVIHLPEETWSHHQSPQEEEKEGGQDEEPAWHSELTLRVESLGAIGVSLRLKQKRLALTLGAESTTVVMQLERGLDELRRRLERCALDDVALRVNLAEPEGDLP